jgi:sporulation protein YlmC with PRC-barrel domain
VVEPLPLVRDVLDKQVYDCNGIKVGKVDGIVLQPRHGRPPRIDVIELHLPTLWRRVSQRLGDWIEAGQRWIDPSLAEPTRIRFEHVTRAGIDVDVDIDANRTNAFVGETWLDTHLIAVIPGGGKRGSKEE